MDKLENVIDVAVYGGRTDRIIRHKNNIIVQASSGKNIRLVKTFKIGDPVIWNFLPTSTTFPEIKEFGRIKSFCNSWVTIQADAPPAVTGIRFTSTGAMVDLSKRKTYKLKYYRFCLYNMVLLD